MRVKQQWIRKWRSRGRRTGEGERWEGQRAQRENKRAGQTGQEIRGKERKNENTQDDRRKAEKIRGKQKKGGENDKGREEEEEHLCQVVDGDGEEENQDTVEKQFAQTNQQASCFQTRLHEQTATRDYICYILNALLHLEIWGKQTCSLTCTHHVLDTHLRLVT